MLGEVVHGKLEMLQVLGETSMLWWVSSSALSAAILGAVWLKGPDERTSSKAVTGALSILVGVFFLTLVVYGMHAMGSAENLRHDVEVLCPMLPTQALLPECGQLFNSEFELVERGLLIGTTTFGIALAAWVIISGSMLLNVWKRGRADAAAHGSLTIDPDETPGPPQD